MRLFIRYGREDRVKYISHLDLMRTFQRALRRSQIPVAFSEGFNPHPRLAFASALAVGVTSSDEYMDILLENPVPPEAFAQRLNQTLPEGIPIYEAVEVDERVPSLMSMIDRATYTVLLNNPLPELRNTLESFMARPVIEVLRKSKKGQEPFDIKPGIYRLEVDSEDRRLDICLQSGSTGNIKPDAVIGALLAWMDQTTAMIPYKIHRSGLFLTKDGDWVSPLRLKKEAGVGDFT